MIIQCTKHITYFGIIRSITSWAKVARELITSLIGLGLDISIYERKGFLYNKNFALDPIMKAKLSDKFKGEIVVTFEHPQNYVYLPRSMVTIGMLVYELTLLPEQWVKNINKFLDMVIVPSAFCARVFRESGVDEKKIHVLRYGFNPSIYYPPVVDYRKESGHFDFLCIASPHRREGLDLLLKSFDRAFSTDPSVRLILKLSYKPSGTIKHFEYDIDGLFQPYEQLRSSGRLQVHTETLNEKQMGDLYRSSHAYVSLSRGEAFGLCFLEGLACGLPICAPSWSGQTDFLNHTNAYPIQFSLVPTSGEEYERCTNKAMIGLPDVHHAAEQMRVIRSDYPTARTKARAAKDLLPQFHWSSVAVDFNKLLLRI
ncbi:MAG: glycosyltransferase [Elusimicrobia bacterium]|nr:glycosyltransferase [Elusimicrobiota bacterium]MBD3412531.1 glycosyltransferase [Elusimicrobiota bacterium]